MTPKTSRRSLTREEEIAQAELVERNRDVWLPFDAIVGVRLRSVVATV